MPRRSTKHIMAAVTSVYDKARRHLTRRDAVLKNLIRGLGACTLQPNDDRFAVLVKAIISQQISTAAARSIRARLEQALAPEGLTAAKILKASESKLRAAGL